MCWHKNVYLQCCCDHLEIGNYLALELWGCTQWLRGCADTCQPSAGGDIPHSGLPLVVWAGSIFQSWRHSIGIMLSALVCWRSETLSGAGLPNTWLGFWLLLFRIVGIYFGVIQVLSFRKGILKVQTQVIGDIFICICICGAGMVISAFLTVCRANAFLHLLSRAACTLDCGRQVTEC